MSKLHDLTPCGTDAEGTPYRHELEMEEAANCPELCGECRGFAAIPHPRAAVSKHPHLYAGVEVILRCRGIALCSNTCMERHLRSHDRKLHEQETRDAEDRAAKKRSAA